MNYDDEQAFFCATMTSASSSASTTPMPLTPQSTGGPSISLSASSSGAPSSPTGEGPSVAKKSRRQAAMFPTQEGQKPVKPFSRSAAKRESVMALGSIGHLQQYFTKTGMVNKNNPLFDKKKHHGLVPAIGAMPLSPTGDEEPPQLPTFASIEESIASYARPEPHTVRSPHVKTVEAHPDTLLPGVINELGELVKAWAIDDPEEASQKIDVLPLLRTTTRTIQTVRNYMLSLPDDSMSPTVNKKMSRRTPSTVAPGSSTDSTPASSSLEPLAKIRRCSLTVLGTLRDLEESARLPLSDDAYDAQSDGGLSRGAHSRGTSPAPGHHEDTQAYGDLGITFSLVQVQGRYEQVPIWEDEDGDFDDEATKEKREIWHETLEVGNGWLYRQDITLNDIPKERKIVQAYLDAVDDALFPSETEGQEKKERGWEVMRKELEMRTSRFALLSLSGARSRSKRRVSSGELLDRGAGGGTQAASHLDPAGGKRRISTGMLTTLNTSRLTAEPEEMDRIREDEEDGDETEQTDDELEDDELPDWAKRATFEDDELGRAYAFLHRFLPSTYHQFLVPPSAAVQPGWTTFDGEPSRMAFLSSLSSGQLLCLAYNVCVRKSKHPWGFVSKEGIHDIISLEKAAASDGRPAAPNKTGWTFRRTDNLRLWIGAVKLRYMLPIQIPSQLVNALPPSLLQLPSVASSASANSRPVSRGPPTSPNGKTGFLVGAQTIPEGKSQTKGSDAVLFDASAVAKKDEGWEQMLETVLLKWMWKAVGEKRKAVPTPIG